MENLFLAPEHVLQGGYFQETLRKLQEPNTSIEPHNLMYPVFLLENEDGFQSVSSMPNVYRYGINKLIPALKELVEKGLKSILIFGIVETLEKDATGTNADSSENPVVKALPKLRAALPQLLLAVDVCLCPYTSHGHCGLLTDNGVIDHANSVKRISEVALAYAKAGAHIVAPSDMMDNRIKGIKDALFANRLQNQVDLYKSLFKLTLYLSYVTSILLLENEDGFQSVSSMPNVYRYGINKLIPALKELVEKGLKSILIFGIVETLEKDATGTNADSPENPVVKALPKLRAALPQLLLAVDVCLCPYTSHGHCGLLTDNGVIDHANSVKRISEVALAYAKAGAHIVAPSDMMDNRIKGIKDALVANRLQNQVSVLSYSCKFASSMYGPFRDTMKSSPMAGDRKCYQLPPGSAGLAMRAAVSKQWYTLFQIDT
ncbi:Delta-aminolevulinic acid dehydratase [Papilio machaon]|uniref:porphobilinogen synthase n=1 Tax=Papilio machaon TaxID=76193 RepID=A0A0N0PCN3_PAPMA|nr:Delta-aminolevulinic acid dehydratase [Papilio machaon]